MSRSPFVPPLPSPESVSIAPPIPAPGDGPPPSWAQGSRTPAHYPYYPATPYNGTPFIPHGMNIHATPGVVPSEPPGSYYTAPSMLPNAHNTPATGGGTGLSSDYTGYPNLSNTPYAPPPQFPPQPPPSAWSHPGTAYNAFHQNLPGGPYGPPPAWYPPYATPGPPVGWGLPPQGPPTWHTPAPWMHPTQPPSAPAAVVDTARADFRWSTSSMDRMTPFAEGSHYGPVLEPFLVRVVKAHLRINPLLAPPTDSAEDYLRWNMLFTTSNCHRSKEPRRSWIAGRGEPATHPRISSMRIISRSFPGMITIQARETKIGITCGELLDRISAYLYGDVAKQEYNSISRTRKRQIYEAYQHNRSTDHSVPGGALGEGMRRLDYLCADSMFGGIVQNDVFVKEHCGDALPCTFELKCLPSYPLTQQELRDQQQRAGAAQRTRSRSHSRAGSHHGDGSGED